MILPDVNVLVFAHREDSPHHRSSLAEIKKALVGGSGLALCEHVLLGFLRVVTHPRIYRPPSHPDQAFAFCDRLRDGPGTNLVSPGPRHWALFQELSVAATAKGDLLPDAFLAALALESGSELISVDEDFGKFPGLKWRRPRA